MQAFLFPGRGCFSQSALKLIFKDLRCWLDHLAPIASNTVIAAMDEFKHGVLLVSTQCFNMVFGCEREKARLSGLMSGWYGLEDHGVGSNTARYPIDALDVLFADRHWLVAVVDAHELHFIASSPVELLEQALSVNQLDHHVTT